MPRIADQELKRLKDEVSVQRLVEASGIVLKKAGERAAAAATDRRGQPLRRVLDVPG